MYVFMYVRLTYVHIYVCTLCMFVRMCDDDCVCGYVNYVPMLPSCVGTLHVCRLYLCVCVRIRLNG
jgi:hypothetical protein